jgi:hypothetical protein
VADHAVALRPWVKWTVAFVWASTAVTVVILSWTHLPTSATITVHVREVSFTTDSPAIFDGSDQNRFSVSGPSDFTLAVLLDRKPDSSAAISVGVHRCNSGQNLAKFLISCGMMPPEH